MTDKISIDSTRGEATIEWVAHKIHCVDHCDRIYYENILASLRELKRIKDMRGELPEGCHRSHPHENMNEDCQRRTQELLEWKALPYLDAPGADEPASITSMRDPARWKTQFEKDCIAHIDTLRELLAAEMVRANGFENELATLANGTECCERGNYLQSKLQIAESLNKRLVEVIDKCKIALDKYEDSCKGWVGDAHVSAKESIRTVLLKEVKE